LGKVESEAREEGGLARFEISEQKEREREIVPALFLG
jgi:hypothetical protein